MKIMSKLLRHFEPVAVFLREKRLSQIKPVRGRSFFNLNDVFRFADKVFPVVHEKLFERYQEIWSSGNIHPIKGDTSYAYIDEDEEEGMAIGKYGTVYDALSALGHETGHHVFGLKTTLPSEIMPIATEELIKRNIRDARVRITTTADDWLIGHMPKDCMFTDKGLYYFGSLAAIPLVDLITEGKLDYMDLLCFKKGYGRQGILSERDNNRLASQLCDLGATPEFTLKSMQKFIASHELK